VAGPLLLVAGLGFEAAPIARAGRHRRLPVTVLVAGPGPERARTLAQALTPPPRLLLGVGLAGALRPLPRGSIVVPESVGAPGKPDLTPTLPLPGFPPKGRLLTMPTVIAEPKEKGHLAAEALAVDQESYLWLTLAAEAGIPMGILRVVLDGPEDALPHRSSPSSWLTLPALAANALAARQVLTSTVLALSEELLR
jgi:nucleoside phosphorylase